MKNSCRAAAEVMQSSCGAAAELLPNCCRNSCGMAVQAPLWVRSFRATKSGNANPPRAIGSARSSGGEPRGDVGTWGDPRGGARTSRTAHERSVCCTAVACLSVGARAPLKWWRHVAPTRSRSAASRMEGFAVALAIVDASLASAVVRWSWMACASVMSVEEEYYLCRSPTQLLMLENGERYFGNSQYRTPATAVSPYPCSPLPAVSPHPCSCLPPSQFPRILAFGGGVSLAEPLLPASSLTRNTRNTPLPAVSPNPLLFFSLALSPHPFFFLPHFPRTRRTRCYPHATRNPHPYVPRTHRTRYPCATL